MGGWVRDDRGAGGMGGGCDCTCRCGGLGADGRGHCRARGAQVPVQPVSELGAIVVAKGLQGIQ